MSVLAAPVMVLHGVLADPGDPTGKAANGALGLLVFLIVAVAVVFLLRSMTKHLRKVQHISFDDDQPDADQPRRPGSGPGQ